MPATYLTFSLHRAAQALGFRHPLEVADIAAGLRQADRRTLTDRASGIHGTREAAEAYAHREGPMLVLTPEGEVLRIERARDAAEDARIAAEERAAADQRRLQPAERWQTEPRFRAI